MNDLLYTKCKEINFTPTHVAEVGVYLPETSNILGFIKDGIKTTLVEPDPNCIEKIILYFDGMKNVSLYPYAIYTENTTIDLYRSNASTFVSTLESSPALVNDKYIPKEEDKFTVEAIVFDKIDDKTIDLLSIDTEGCEWFILQNLLSKPKVISIETHGKKYRNPFIKDIQKWINQNNYKIWYQDKSDTILYKSGFLKPSLRDKISLFVGYK
jgi:FkbM family methyltransferase